MTRSISATCSLTTLVRRLLFSPGVRAQTETSTQPPVTSHEPPVTSRRPRAASRPITNLGGIAHGEPRIEELLELLDWAHEPQRRVYILQEIARVYREELSDTPAASVALRAALQEDCTHPAVIAAIGQLADEADYWDILLAELMEDAAELGGDDPPRAADLWVRIGSWYDDPVGHRDYAVQSLKRALELAPHHTEALAALAGLLRQDGYWVELAGVLESQAAAAEGEQRIAALLSLAEVADTHLDDHTLAITACRSALDVDGGCRPAFDILRSLLYRTGEPEQVAELLTRRSALIDDPDEFVELTIDVARIYGERLGDAERAERTWAAIEDVPGAIARLAALIDSADNPAERAALHYRIGWFSLRGNPDRERAEWNFSQALAEDPTHVPALRALAEVYRRRRDWRKASLMLGRAAEHAGAELRAALVVDHACILADELDDLDGAIELCRAATAAGEPAPAITRILATFYARLGRWHELEPLLDDLEAEMVSHEHRPRMIGGLYHLIARTAAERGDRDRALAYYHEAHRLAPDDAEVQRGLADQYFARNRMAEAASEYRALLATPASQPGEPALWYRLGVALRTTGDQLGALEAFTRVAELEPSHLPAVEATAELLVGLRRWRAAARAKHAQLELAPPDEAQEVRIELGDLYRDHLDDPRFALELYSEAVESRPDDHVALQRRLDTATSVKDWPVAVDSIQRFAAVESVALRRGAYLYTAAVICRDELGDDAGAADWLERALDAYFAGPDRLDGDDLARAMKAFVALDALHTRRRAWPEQARAYRRMIKRLPADHPVLGDLWHALGEIYRSRLRRYQEAAAAFEVARSLNPDDLERRTILAELYQLTSDSPTSAADEHQAVLARDPGRADSYRALKELFLKARRMDQAWCACRALVFLERATPAETELYRRYRSESIAKLRTPLTAELSRHFVHPDESGLIPLSLAVVRAELAAARPTPLKLRAREQIEVTPRDDRRLRLLAHVASALDRPLPAVYDQTGRAGPLAFGLCRIEGALRPVLAPRADYLRADDKTAAFVAGRALSLLHPERVLSVLFTEDELGAILAWIAGRPEPGPMTDLLEDQVAARMRPDQLEQLLQAREALATTDPERELARWLRAVVITSDRVGLLVSGSLHASTRVVAGLRGAPSSLPPAERVLELLRYSVTDDYARIRRHLCGRS